ncbi:MAG: hypothetical protein ACRELV_04365 [Longimicrobiales bacterium]
MRPIHSLFILGLALGLSASATRVRAQAWDTPTFLSTSTGEDIGVYFLKGADWGGDSGFGGDDDWGVSAIWRQALNPNMGVRAGIIRTGTDDTEFIVGAETWGDLLAGEFPVDLMWMLGAGANLAEGATWLRVPAGVGVGRTFGTEGGIRFTPYVLPRVALDVIAFDRDLVGEGEDASDTELNFVADLGVDLELTPTIRVRLGASFGEVDAYGAGIALRFAREVEVQ